MKVAIVGTSGAVGQELLKGLEERNFPLDELVLFGSARSAGQEYEFKGKKLIVQELKKNDDFKDVDIALTSAGGGTSKNFAETIIKHGAIMIDNSSAFRMEKDVPLVVPEINAADLHDLPRNIVANPNCTTIQMVMCLQPIEKLSHVKRVHAATYQSASGAGAAAMQELVDQMKQLANGEELSIEKFPYQLVMNLIPQVDVFTENLYTKEEIKMYNESQKIMHSDIEVSTTCVRVPVLRNHSEALWIETEDPLSVEQVQEAMEAAEGVTLIDNPEKQEYPMPIIGEGKDDIYVGRIRKDLTNPNGIALWCVGDQIRKGAALNAIQIAEYMVKEGLV